MGVGSKRLQSAVSSPKSSRSLTSPEMADRDSPEIADREKTHLSCFFCFVPSRSPRSLSCPFLLSPLPPLLLSPLNFPRSRLVPSSSFPVSPLSFLRLSPVPPLSFALFLLLFASSLLPLLFCWSVSHRSRNDVLLAVTKCEDIPFSRCFVDALLSVVVFIYV